MTRRIPDVITILVTAALLAGCVGGGSPEPLTGTSLDTVADGDAYPGDMDANATEAVAPPPRPDPVEVDVSFSGETGTFACAFVAELEECHGQFSDSAFQALEYTGTPYDVEGVVTWELTSPTAQRLTISVFALEEDGSFDYRSPVAQAEGSSPLSFRFDLTRAEGLTLMMDVSSVQDAGVLVASVEQAFDVEATFVYRPEA